MSAVGIGGANGNSIPGGISSNGQFVVFASEADDLVNGDTNAASDIFVRDLSIRTTRLVSVDLSGNAPVDQNPSSIIPLSGNPLISSDGQWVFFESRAVNLTAVLDTNAATDVFARNLETNITVLVSTDRSGNQAAGGASSLASVSSDGRYVAFISTGTNIAAGGTNTEGDVYRRDMVSGDRVCGSKNVGTLVPGGYCCVQAVLSADGRYAAFATVAASNGIFRHDFLSDTTRLVALRATNTEGTIQISADGRYVAFDDGTNVFRFDARTGTNEIVSESISGTAPASGIARNPVMTLDGNGIAFVSNPYESATSSSSLFQIYARDMSAGKTWLVSAATNGQPSVMSHETSLITLGADLSPVGFDSATPDLVNGDGNSASDVFVRDLTKGTTQLVSAREPSRARTSGIGHTLLNPYSISADGRFIAFTSYDNDLVPGDTNGWSDVFVYDASTGTAVSAVISTNLAGYPAISADGNYVVYRRRSIISILDAAGGAVFRLDRATGIDDMVSQAGGGARPAISSNGNLIAFLSNGNLSVRNMRHGTNLFIGGAEVMNFGFEDPADAVLTPDDRFVLFKFGELYAYDLLSNRTHLVSFLPGSRTVAIGFGGSLSVSANSRFLTFYSSLSSVLLLHDLLSETNGDIGLPRGSGASSLSADGRLIAYRTGNSRQIVVWDRQTDNLDLLTPSLAERGPKVTISGDGRFVLFGSSASDLVPNDTNSYKDIFVRDRLLGTTTLISHNASGSSANAASMFRPIMAADGRTVVFQSMASDLVDGDYNDKRDIFILKLGGADRDGDGLDDDWEVAYFGNLSRAGSDDFDGDGQTDLQEFSAGTDPTNSDSIFRVLTVTPLGGGSTRVIWNASPGRAYRVEFKNSVTDANWTPVTEPISWSGSTASLTDASATSMARHYRVVRLP